MLALAPTRTWALSLSALSESEGDGILKVTRAIFPHDTMDDAVYALDRFAPEDPLLHQAQPAEKVLTVEGRWVATALGKKWQRVTLTAGGN